MRADISNEYNALITEAHNQVSSETHAHPATKAFFNGMLATLHSDEEAAHTLQTGLTLRAKKDVRLGRSPMGPSQAGNFVLRLVHFNNFERYGDAYAGIDTTLLQSPEWWAERTREYFISSDTIPDCVLLDVYSSVPERYKAVPLAVSAYKPELLNRPERSRIADFGTSVGHGIISLAAGIPLGTVRLLDEQADSSLERAVNAAITDTEPYTKMTYTGLDRMGPDNRIRQKARSDSVPPHEMTSERLRSYDKLDKLTPVNVSFNRFPVDVSAEPEVFLSDSEQNGLQLHSYDIVVMSSLLYYLSETSIRRTIANARQLLTEDGLIVVNEFITLKKDRSSFSMRTEGWYSPEHLPYQTALQTPDSKWSTIIRWTNGRMQHGKVTDSLATRL